MDKSRCSVAIVLPCCLYTSLEMTAACSNIATLPSMYLWAALGHVCIHVEWLHCGALT